MASLLIRGGRVFDGDGFSDADVFIDEGIVQQIAPGIEIPAKTVFNAQGMTVLPGLASSRRAGMPTGFLTLSRVAA